MKRNLVNFTRGSQLLGHFGFMFASGFKAPLIIAATLLVGMSYWMVTLGLSDHQRYLVGMNLYASLYGFMEFDPAKPVNLDLAGGSSIEIAISAIQNLPPVVHAMEALWSALRTALVISALLFLPAFILFYWVAEYFGGRSKESKHERGAQLATLPALEAEITRHNAAEQAREMKTELGWRWRLAGQSGLAAAGYYQPSPHAHLLFYLAADQEKASRWLQTDLALFFEKLVRYLPDVLETHLGEHLHDVKPHWANGTAKRIARLLAQHIEELARRDDLLGTAFESANGGGYA